MNYIAPPVCDICGKSIVGLNVSKVGWDTMTTQQRERRVRSSYAAMLQIHKEKNHD